MRANIYFNSDKNWTLDYYEYNPEKERQREALCTIGNSFFCSRGNIDGLLDPEVSYPATYISGVYNKLSSSVHNQNVVNEDLVRCPDFMSVNFRIADEEWLDISQVDIIEYHQQLNLKNNILCRYILFKDNKNRITSVVSKRLISMASTNFGALQYIITPQNYASEVSFKSVLKGNIENKGVKRYEDLNSNHLHIFKTGEKDDIIYLTVKTNQSKIIISGASRAFVMVDNKEIQPIFKYNIKKTGIEQSFTTYIPEKRSLKIEKVSSIQISKKDEFKLQKDNIASLFLLKRWNELYYPHVKAWESLWKRVDIEVDGDHSAQSAVRLHIHHLLITASIHTKNQDLALPARGLTGEAYRGHIFWDEIFMFPFYIMHFPNTAKSILMYRYRRLDMARIIARKYGFKGALYPWQSENDGSEGSQKIHLNPVSGKWEKDHSSLQNHITSAVVYNIWSYFELTLDFEFLNDFGAEIIFEVAKFWSSKAAYNRALKKYEIDNVMGPDEFHEVNPKSPSLGLKNNTYTNIMAVWTLMKSLDLLSLLPSYRLLELKKKLKIDDDEIAKWTDISTNMQFSIREDGIVSQFDGFLNLRELDWVEYRKKYCNISRMDRILKAESKTPDDYQVLKQADFLTVFYLFSFEEVKKIFNRNGYKITDDFLKNNFFYYINRTTHGSTLSFVVHSYIANLVGEKEICQQLFNETLRADIDDIQCGTTEEGIHLGMMGGSINVVLSTFAGITINNRKLCVNPNLPGNWTRMKFNFQFMEKCYHIEILQNVVRILVTGNDFEDFGIELCGKHYRLELNHYYSINY